MIESDLNVQHVTQTFSFKMHIKDFRLVVVQKS